MPNNQDLETIAKKGSEIFREIRDITYFIGGTHDPNGLYREGRGTCTRKHLKLKEELEKIGYDIRIRISNFDWKELPFSQQVIDKLGDNTIEPHMSLYFRLGEYEGIIDLTFDRALKQAGFIVNDWDGLSHIGSTVKEIGQAKIYNPNLLMLRGKVSDAFDVLLNIKNKIHGREREQERWNRNVDLINGYLDKVREDYSSN